MEVYPEATRVLKKEVLMSLVMVREVLPRLSGPLNVPLENSIWKKPPVEVIGLAPATPIRRVPPLIVIGAVP